MRYTIAASSCSSSSSASSSSSSPTPSSSWSSSNAARSIALSSGSSSSFICKSSAGDCRWTPSCSPSPAIAPVSTTRTAASGATKPASEILAEHASDASTLATSPSGTGSSPFFLSLSFLDFLCFSRSFAFSARSREASERGGGALGGSPSEASNDRSTAPSRIASKGGNSSADLSISASRSCSSAVPLSACLMSARSRCSTSSPPFRNRHKAIAIGLAGALDVSPSCSSAVSVSKSINRSPSSFCNSRCKSVNVLTSRRCNSFKHSSVAASKELPGVVALSLALTSSR
mmetsp:Transcript_59523/g.171882  ORF Transcript_59523/g.171882 Transcript_59523/m.171882 type:complete len:289 (-) Transcript_59523:3566-4432(-)